MIKKLTQHQVVRYIIGGGTSATVSLSLLFVFNSILHIYYITASIMSFLIAFFVSWTFHKFWTFKERSTDNMHKQGGLYLLTSLFGLSLNTLILYVSVDIVHLPVLVGQIIAGVLVACCTFFISKHVVFKKKAVHSTEDVLNKYL
jgi:putative flippase GtrA